MTRWKLYLVEKEKISPDKDKKEEEKSSDDKEIPRNEKGEPDYTGTGIKPEEGWKTPEQREQDSAQSEVDSEAQRKSQEDKIYNDEMERLKDRDAKLHSKFGRLLATQEELEELDKERDEQEEYDRKLQKAENPKEDVDDLDENGFKGFLKKKVVESTSPNRKKTVEQLKNQGWTYTQSHGVWTKGKKKGKIDPITGAFAEISGKESTKGSSKEVISKKPQVQPKIIDELPIKERAKKDFEKEKERKKEEREKEREKNLSTHVGKKIVGKKKGATYETNIGGKDKTLNQKINTSKEKAFTDTLYNVKKGDDAFYKKTKNYEGHDLSIKNKWKTPSWLFSSGKVPKREVQIFERMMNTKLISSTEPPISFFTDGGPGGAGKIQAQAGELMTMMTTSMSRDERKEFEKNVSEHISNLDPKTSIVTKDWLKASINNSTAIHNRIQSEFDVDDASEIITHTCWDIKEDVEALGLKDYKKNKGFSSDIYVKLKLPNGQQILNEISLKKDKNVFFLNSSTGKLKNWDKNLPDDINPEVYANNLKNKLSKTINTSKINKLISSSNTPAVKELNDLLSKQKSSSIDDFISANNRSSRKILLAAIKAQAEHGDEKSIKMLKTIDKEGRNYSINAIKAIGTNKKLKQGMLSEVKSEFPIKAVTENEETMAIGDMSVDRKVVKNIFGTDNWDEIQEHLTAVTDKEPPYLAYKAKGKKDMIPIAIINVREDGVNYGATFKFEMALDKRFAKLLKDANMKLYGKEKVEESMLYKWILYTDLVEDD
jgi:hypothetical protein